MEKSHAHGNMLVGVVAVEILEIAISDEGFERRILNASSAALLSKTTS